MPYFPQVPIQNYTSLLNYINNVTTFTDNGQNIALFGPSMLIVIFSIVFISLKFPYDTIKAFVTAIFVTMFSGIFMSAIGLLDGITILALIAISLLSTFLLYKFGD